MSAASAPAVAVAALPKPEQVATRLPTAHAYPTAVGADAEATSPTSTSTTAAPSLLDVTRTAGVIHIQAVHAPLADAVRALAQATHSHVRGAEALALAPAASTVTLTWQGRDAAGAWNALLGNAASTAVSCNNVGCAVWIVAATAAAPQRVGAAATTHASATTAAAQGDVQAGPLQAAPQTGSEENTETN